MNTPPILIKLFEVSRRMAETRALEPLLEYIMDTALETFDGENGFIILLNERQELIYRLARNNKGENIPNPETQISHSILHDVLQSRQPILTSNAIEDPVYHHAKSVEALHLASVIAVPLISRGNLLGALYLENRSKPALFTTFDVDPLRFFASQAAISIENALLNDELEARVQRRTKELALAHELLQQEMLEQKRAQVITNFIESASHHFRTPLTIINTNADLLRRRANITGYERYITGIFDQTAAILNLVNSLVTMAQLDSLDQLELTSHNLNEILHEIQIITTQQIPQRDLTLHFEIPQQAIIANVDHDYLRQAIIELIHNAMTYTPDGGDIYVRLYRQDHQIYIDVVDTGVGMEPEIIPMIFDRFYRVDRAGTSRGFGLGLAIVHRIMEMHNAKIEVMSELNKGSTFRLILSE
ncbi:MAG: GAF domain-containing protein [Chloroflexi bacterium]|nr:MAG: GAF domain-containing protein [Chloroflexota bacterium]